MELKNRHIILASGSPRRREILKEHGIDFEIIKPDCSEETAPGLSPDQIVMTLAERKAKCVLSENPGILGGGNLILASDTVVAFDGEIMGKPVDEADAFRMLSELNGKMNFVYSGVCILSAEPSECMLFAARTDVYFKKYTDEDINAYIATGEPMDKAGAYAIQGGFAPYADHIDGDFDNVVGLPYDELMRRCKGNNNDQLQ